MISIVNPTQPLVSVIIPTYNRPDYLRAAIESVCKQTYPHLEIIVSDDGSQQNPQTIVESFGDPRLRLRRNPQNLGVGLNVTHAMAEVQGTYVAFLNDDDTWAPTFLETLIAPLEANPSLVLAFCDHYIMTASGDIDLAETEASTRRWHRHQLAPGVHQPFCKIGLVDQAVYSASAAVIRRDAVDWQRLYEAGVFWDYFIVYLACRSQKGAFYCPERLVAYRVHDQSETTLSGHRNVQAKIRKGRAAIACHDTYRKDDALRAFWPFFQRQWAEANATLGIGLLRDSNPTEARPYLLKAFQGNPLSLRPLVALMLSFLPRPLAQPLLYSKSS
jgi:glycosyltransferase involved in cell wall biosynthesis